MVFSYIVYKSRATATGHGEVMKDPRINKMMTCEDMPFDGKRMIFGGFKTMRQRLVSRRTKGKQDEARQANITPCLWFDDQAEQAAAFYTSIFKDSRSSSRSPAMAMWVARSTAGRRGRC